MTPTDIRKMASNTTLGDLTQLVPYQILSWEPSTLSTSKGTLDNVIKSTLLSVMEDIEQRVLIPARFEAEMEHATHLIYKGTVKTTKSQEAHDVLLIPTAPHFYNYILTWLHIELFLSFMAHNDFTFCFLM